jgi:hypothetical protein
LSENEQQQQQQQQQQSKNPTLHPVCIIHELISRSRDSSVNIMKGYWLEDCSSIPGRGKGFFFTPQRSELSTQP